MTALMIVLILLGWLCAWRQRRRANQYRDRYSRRAIRDRRQLAARLKREGWDVMPAALIGAEGPLLRDTEWNRIRQYDLGHEPGRSRDVVRPDA